MILLDVVVTAVRGVRHSARIFAKSFLLGQKNRWISLRLRLFLPHQESNKSNDWCVKHRNVVMSWQDLVMSWQSGDVMAISGDVTAI